MRKSVEFFRVEQAIRSIEADFFQQVQLDDATVSVRIVGEFSSGKTRLLREIFGEGIPQALRPVSSLETQTLVPLEVTYGETPLLQLIRRREDSDKAEVLSALDRFPNREELRALVPDPEEFRLRLHIAEPRLTLADGDGYYEDSTTPQRLRIIDQPGWNSEDEGDDWERLGLSGEWKNLALVYVCRAERLDSRQNQESLKLFLQAFLDGSLEPARERLPLLFVITNCAPEDRKKFTRLQEERIVAHLGDSVESFPVKVVTVDFSTMSGAEREAFRKEFWKHILSESPSPPLLGIGADAVLRRWPPEWALRPYLDDCLAWLGQLQRWIDGLRAPNGFMRGRTMDFFGHASGQQLVDSVRADWRKSLENRAPGLTPETLQSLAVPDLPPDHCLRPWLDNYWLPRLAEPLDALRHFVSVADRVFNGITPEVTDLEGWLAERLEAAHLRAVHALSPSFIQLCRMCRTLPEDTPPAVVLGTLLAASLFEARYAETRNQWTGPLREGAGPA